MTDRCYNVRMESQRVPIQAVGHAIRAARVRLGWSQTVLARRAGLSRSMVSRVERGERPRLTFATAGRILGAMGARMEVKVEAPVLAAGTWQRDPAHARLSAYVVGRLRHAGWSTATEVEVGGDRSRGWIDLLAFDAASRIVLVIELKTEIHDLGQIERTLGWYEREAWTAARRLGWRPLSVMGWLILLATGANDARVLANRASILAGFPRRSRHLTEILAGPSQRPAGTTRFHVGTTQVSSWTSRAGVGRGVAMIDPRSRRKAWVRPLVIDGRPTPSPYRDYADFMRAAMRRTRERSDSRFPACSTNGPRAR